MFLGCLNPKSGSFVIDLRLSRHFTMVALGTPEKEILNTVYGQIFGHHLKSFDNKFNNYAQKIVNATSAVFNSIALSPQFMPTAKKFHYQFNLRDFTKIIQNLLNCDPSPYAGKPQDLVRCWAHECNRVYLDRLIIKEDVDKYNEFMGNAMKEFSDLKPADILAEPLIFTSFISVANGHEAAYVNIKDEDQLKNCLEDKLEQYNENVGAMDLVLFSIACQHITKSLGLSTSHAETRCSSVWVVPVSSRSPSSLPSSSLRTSSELLSPPTTILPT
jgi:dynein heavy chain